jgi:hypothetical protein
LVDFVQRRNLLVRSGVQAHFGPGRAIAVLATLLALSGASSARSERAQKKQWWEGLKTPAKSRAIIDAGTARQRWSKELPEGEFWTPTLADVKALERDLPGYLRQKLRDEPQDRSSRGVESIPLWKKAPLYLRQYVGTTRKGQRAIYGHFFCDIEHDWRRYPVIIFDGGDCFFQLFYDVKTGRFDGLALNGVA